MNNTNKDLQQTSPSYHSDEEQIKNNYEQPKSIVATVNHLNSESIPKQIAITEGKPDSVVQKHIDSGSNSLSNSTKDDYSGSHSIAQRKQYFEEYYNAFLEHEDYSTSKRSLNANTNASTKSNSTSTSKRLKHFPPEPWNKYEDVLLEEIMHDDYEAESKRTNVVLLNIKVNETTKNKNISIYSAKTGKGLASNDISYDRIFLFGSLCGNKCFVVISSTKKNSARLLSKFTDGCYTVGQTAVILEPVYMGKTLGKEGNLPILEVQKVFEPYIFPWVITIPYREPEEVCTTYFYLKGVSIKIQLAEMQKSNCSGILCDRQKLEKNCPCLYKSGRGQLVIDCWLKIYDSTDENSILLQMQNFRSWNFTQLILDKVNASMIVDDFRGEQETKLRNSIKNIVNYCNKRGGWDLFGWMRRGHQIDASDDKLKGEQITAETISPHIIRLIPSQATKEDFKLNKLLYEENTIYLSLE